MKAYDPNLKAFDSIFIPDVKHCWWLILLRISWAFFNFLAFLPSWCFLVIYPTLPSTNGTTSPPGWPPPYFLYSLCFVLYVAYPQSNFHHHQCLHFCVLFKGVSLLKGNHFLAKTQPASWAKKANLHLQVAFEESFHRKERAWDTELLQWIQFLEFLSASNDCTYHLFFPVWLLWDVPFLTSP